MAYHTGHRLDCHPPEECYCGTFPPDDRPRTPELYATKVLIPHDSKDGVFETSDAFVAAYHKLVWSELNADS